MKTVRKVVSGVLVLLVIFTAFMFMKDVSVYADGVAPYVIIESYEVSGGTIIPGQDFEMSVTVQNADPAYVAKNVIVTITTIDGINTIYPSVPQMYIGDIAPNEKKTVKFSYKVTSSYSMDTASFYTSIITDDRTNSIILTAPVELDDAAFSVLSKNIPTEAGESEKISASLYFRVRGEQSLNNVTMRLYVDGEESVSSEIGNVSQGASKTQNMTFSIDEQGEHDLKFVLEGIDQDGLLRETEVYTGTISIIEPQKNVEMFENNTVVNIRPKRDYAIIGGCVGLIILLGAAIVWVLRKNN